MVAWLARVVPALLIALWAAQPAAHEIPVSTRLQVFVVPAAGTVSVLLRVPLAAMGDVDYPVRPGNTVAVSEADGALRDAAILWIIPAVSLVADGRTLPPPRIAAARMALPSDRSFGSYATARAGLDAPRLDDGLELYWSQQMLDVLLEYPVPSPPADLAVNLAVDRFGQDVATSLRFVPPGGETRAYALHGNAGLIHLDPSGMQAALTFVQAGMGHILGGADHLLFLACLVIPFRRLRPLVALATAFTVGHSVSLAASALDFVPDGLWFPPLVELLIAGSILYMALENIIGAEVRRRWGLAFGFGVVHGFGFSFGLRETMQFAGGHLFASLAAFNVGVEIGQALVLLVLVPALDLFLRRIPSERVGVVVLSAMVAHLAWHWTEARWDVLARFPMPKLDLVLLLGAMRGLTAMLILGSLVWLVRGALDRWLQDVDRVRPQQAARQPSGMKA